MSVVSLLFLAFLGVTLIIYYVVPKRIQWWILLAVGAVFYAYAGIKYIAYIILSITISFFAARKMTKMFEKQNAGIIGLEKAEQKQFKEQMKSKRRKVLTIALIAVIALLAFLKYYTFTVNNINAVIGLFGMKTLPELQFILPIGISFYTFQIIAYLTDVYRGKCKAQTNFARYALFISFFPQITQGPIARYEDLAPQLFAQRKIEFDNLRFGAQLMIWGFFKKLVIADRLALFVNTVYGNYTNYSGFIFVIATVLFSVQIYADFSGCMDIACGAAEMFGIKLAKNFNHPYFSKTMPEFWRRWHITLGAWFKDYVFYPISVSKFALKMNKKARKALGNAAGRIISACYPVLIVWVLTGLWHGAQWNYVLWGLFHGILIMLGIIFSPFNEKMTARLHIKTESFVWRLFQMLRTFFLCCVARVFFRAESIAAAWSIFIRMFQKWNVQDSFFSLGLDVKDFTVAIVSMLILLVVSILQERMEIREVLAKRNIVLRWAIYYTAIFSVIIFGIYGPSYSLSGFIYERF